MVIFLPEGQVHLEESMDTLVGAYGCSMDGEVFETLHLKNIRCLYLAGR